MGVQHSKKRAHLPSNSACQSQASMSTTGEMSIDGPSDASVELGEPYDRIEYPREVYDRVCGRKLDNDPPLTNEKKVEDWLATAVDLSDTQSSQKTCDLSEVSPKDRKRKKKETHDDGSVPSKDPSADSPYRSAKTGTKKSLQSLKRMKDYDSEEEESSDNLFTDEDEEYSEVDSSPEMKGKKKRRTDSKVQQTVKTREDTMTEKKRARIEKAKEEKEKIEPQKSKHGKSEKPLAIITEKKERKDVKSERRDQFEDLEDRGDKLNSQQEDNKERKKKEENRDKDKPPKINEDIEEKSHSKGEEKKEKKEPEPKKRRISLSDAFLSSLDAKKSVSREKVSSTSKQSGVITPASSKSSDVPPLSHRKSIVKKHGTQTKTSSSDDSVLPSCMQQLFKDSPAPSASSSLPSASPSLSNSAFKIPKKKDTSDGRHGKKHSDPPAVELTPEERGEGGEGWDPRSIAFVPPRRTSRRPPPKPPMEKQERIIPRPALLGVYPGSNVDAEEKKYRDWVRSEQIKYEEWRNTVDWGAMLFAPPSISALLSSNQSSIGETSSAFLPQKRIDQSGTDVTRTSCSVEKMRDEAMEGSPSSSHKKSSDGMTPRDDTVTSSSLYPTPTWTGKRETEHDMVDCDSMWSPFNSTSSPEPAEKEDSRWNEFTPSIEGGRKENKYLDYSNVEDMARHINHVSPPPQTPPPPPPPRQPSTSACRRLVFEPQPKPLSINPEKLIRYRLFPIDDECLPRWNRSDRFKKKYRAMAVAGTFADHVDKRHFEKIMKERGADVAWTEAPPTKNYVNVLDGRAIGVILCQSQAEAMEIAEEKWIRVKCSHIPVGIPMEVLFKLEGVIRKNINETDLIEEMTDAIEADIGELVELMFFPPKDDLVIEGKARFFFSVHGSRAVYRTELSLGGGREITFTECPPEKSTPFVVELFSDPPCDEEALKKLEIPVPRIIPVYPCNEPQPVPPPSLVSLSTTVGPIKMEPGTSLPNTTTVSTSSTLSQSSSREGEMYIPGPSPQGSSRLSSLPNIADFMAIPPPGLVVTPMLLTPTMVSLAGKTFSIPSISVPAGVIPMPPQPIPPPTDIVPILPYPDLSPTEHFFFAAPPPRRRRSGGAERPRLINIDPRTFIRPFEALLPKREEIEEEEILLFARPETTESQEKIDWDAVRAYFKDEDCSSRVYGGIVSLRFTGGKAKEKAQMLMLNSPHTVNGQSFSIGLTFSVLYEASRAVGKTRLYEEIMEKFGSVVEVEKKCDSPAGKPSYKIYFDSLEKAQTAATEGITVGESTLVHIGKVPTE